MKALDLLKTNKSVAERAENYATSMKRNIQRDVIDTLIGKKEKIEDDIFELSNFTLDTNVNRGISQMTKEDCESRFKKLIELDFQLELINVELRSKSNSFNKYFGEIVSITNEA